MFKKPADFKLSRLDLIQSLYQVYYTDESTPESHLSSHWKMHSLQFEVDLNESGFPADLLGSGFGNFRGGIVAWIVSIVAFALHLTYLSNRIELFQIALRYAIPLAQRMGLVFSQDAFRQVCTLVFVRPYLSKADPRILIIGDGYGFLASLFKEIYPNAKLTLVDLGKTLLFQAYYCQLAHSICRHDLASSLSDRDLVDGNYDFLYCPADRLQCIDKTRFDLAVNVASMQEMNAESVATYFDFLRLHRMPPLKASTHSLTHSLTHSSLFYCCNRERKVMPGGEVQEFARYPWLDSDAHLVDEICPWHRIFFGYELITNGPSLLGIRIPFVNYYAGSIRHRLTQLSEKT